MAGTGAGLGGVGGSFLEAGLVAESVGWADLTVVNRCVRVRWVGAVVFVKM